MVKSEEFVAQGQMVESKSDHLALPCKLNTNGCETGDETFVFDYMPTCSLKRIQSFTGSRVLDIYLVDEDKAILLNITGVMIAPQECGSAKLLSTNYPKLFTAETHDADLHITIQERVQEDFLAYQMEKRMTSVQHTLKSTICQQTISSTIDIPLKLPTGHYAYRRGDLLFVISCVQKRGAISELSTCHDKIPVNSNRQVWVDPVTRLHTQHSTQLPCSKKFPITINLSNSTWVAITPSLVPVAALDQTTLEQSNMIEHL